MHFIKCLVLHLENGLEFKSIFLRKKKMKNLSLLLLSLVLFTGCKPVVQSVSGTKMAKVGALNTDANGHTIEQNNIIKKIKIENDESKTWFLYVISPFDRKIIMKSVVVGKVTSSGKRLTPTRLSGEGMRFPIGDWTYFTDELPSEDGTYGSSTEYIYWTDNKARNRRHFLLDGQIIHLVDQEMTNEELLGEIP